MEEAVFSDVQLLYCNLLNLFPPCQIRNYYFKFITENIDLPKYIPNKSQTDISIIDFIISHIEFTMSDAELYGKEKSAGELIHNAMNSSELLNFSDWELKQETEHFDLLLRTEKIERLFCSLDLIVRLFEADLAVFMMKYQKDVLLHLFDESTQPLVVAAFKMTMYKMSSILVKRTLKIFSNLLAFDYPEYCLDIFSVSVSILFCFSKLIKLCLFS